MLLRPPNSGMCIVSPCLAAVEYTVAGGGEDG